VYDFSCALRGTFARTVEPGEKGTPANLKEASAACAVNVETTFSVKTNRPTKSNLFKKLRMSSGNHQEAGLWVKRDFIAGSLR
jgi:hypothetical protein